MYAACQLCGQNRQLQFGHIIPKFVFAWAKDSALGFLRSSKEPNVRVQDGEKQRLFCFDCEQRLSVWEQAFYESVFAPLHDKGATTKDLEYGDWALKFAASVSLRNLLCHRQNTSELRGYLSEEQFELAEKAFTAWREFLLAMQENPREYEQHILTFDFIGSHTVPFLSPYMNRYLVRAIDTDLLCADGVTVTYTKLGRLAIFGFIQMEDRNKWRGTKIHLKRGKIGSAACYIPQYLLQYLSDRADHIAASIGAISEKQSTKITEAIVKDPAKAVSSEVVQAVARDVTLFGNRAFWKKGRDSSS